MEESSLIFHSKYWHLTLKTTIIILFASVLFAQESKVHFTGIAYLDAKQVSQLPKPVSPIITTEEAPKKKSVLLSGALSALLPGAGEFYSEEYIKSAIFLSVEAAAIVVGLIYDKKGNDQTNSFQSYANQHWDAGRYARWTLVHAHAINPAINAANYNVFDGYGKVVWSELNRLEAEIGMGTNYYSHRLAYFGDQQYYEMIGKYPQFNPGWDDFGNENTPYRYGDRLTDRFYYYSSERGKANDFYNIASKAVVVIISNHVISMFDAIWSAASFNKRVQANVSLKKDQIGFRTEYSTVLNLKYNF